METQQFLDDRFNRQPGIFNHELLEAVRELMIDQYLLRQITIENSPARAI